MKALLANLLLGLLWLALTGKASSWNFLLGLGLGFMALRGTQGASTRSVYFRKVPEAIGFLGFFLKELVVSSLRVAWDVVTPRLRMRPAILAVPLDAKTDAEITLLACLVTLTPGTLTLDVSPDRRHIFIHALFVRDYEEARAAIKDGVERRILRLMR